MPRSPLFTGTLPQATPGPHKSIGYAYIRTRPTRVHSIASPRLATSNVPILKVEEIGYALFYPCQKTEKQGWVGWFPESVREMVKGYEIFLGKEGVGWLLKGLKLVVGRLKFGAGQNSPLEPSKLLYPLIIFSHGLAGTRHTYTQYVTALASQGYVVLVLEHRDGSAPAVSLPPLSESLDGHDGSAAAGCKDKERILHYLKLPDLAWDDEEDKSLMRFRTLQLDMRVRETYEAYHSFKRLTNGDHESVTVIDGLKKVDEAALLSSFRDKVNIDSVTLTGHSFGAGTLLHLLQIPSPDTTLPAIPINRVICLDPWLEPLPTPTPASPEPSITVPPVLAINAPGFTVWEDHFVQCVDIVQKLNGSLVTLLGANHQSFSDFPLFAPSNPTPALDLLTTIHDLSMAFMNGNLTSAKGIEGKKADNGAYDGREQRKMVGRKGDVIVHVLGTQS